MSSKTNSPNQVLISEAANILGVSIDTVRRWDKKGILKSARIGGKNRYFNIDDLEKLKISKPLGISETAKKLNISATTLRRLEKKGVIKPERNTNGERVYSLSALKDFLNGQYFLGQKAVQEQVFEPIDESKPPEFNEKNIAEHKIIGAIALDGKEHIGRLERFQNALIYSSSFLAISVVLIISIITTMFLLVPEQASNLFGVAEKVAPLSYVSDSTGSVLGVSTTAEQSNFSLGFLKPFTKVSLGIVKTVNNDAYVKIVPKEDVQSISQVFQTDSATGNLELLQKLHFPNSSYLVIPDQNQITNLNSEFLQGKIPGVNSGNIAVYGEDGSLPGLVITRGMLPSGLSSIILIDSSITTTMVSDGAITSAKLASGITFTPSDGSVTSSKIYDGTITSSDISGSAGIGDGKLSQLTSVDKVAGSAVQLASAGGLRNDTGLSLKACSADELLVWSGSAWTCTATSSIGGGGEGTITSVTAGTGLTGGGSTGAISLAVTGLTTSELSATAGITSAQLAGSIAYSKLSLTGAVLNADLAGSIEYSKLSLTGAILNADLAGSIAASKLVGTDIATVGTLTAGSIGSGFGNIALGTSTFSGKSLALTSTTEQLRIGYDVNNYFSTTVGSTGGVTFDAVGAGSAFTFSDSVTFSGGVGGAGAFTTLSSSGATTLGTGSSLTNTFGSGESSINTIGSVTTPGTLTLHGATTLDNTLSVSGSNLTSLGGNLTVTGTAWTATPTISGLITATSGLTSSGTLTVGANQNFAMSSGTGTVTQTFTGTDTTASTVTANSLTSGNGLSITSSATAFTGALGLFTLSGSNVSNTGSVLSVADSGALNTTTSFKVTGAGAATQTVALVENTGSGTSFRVNDAASDTSPFLIDAGGNVGIGSTTPTAKLDVLGNAIFTNAVTSGTPASATQINTGDPNTKGLIIKGNTYSTAYSTVVLADTPTAYYRYGESSGANAVDSSGNNNTATYQTVTYSTTGLLTNDANTAITLAGGNTNYVALPSFSTGTTFTIEMWVKPNGSQAYQALFTDTLGSQGLFYRGDVRKFSYFSTTDHLSNTAITNNTTHHIVVSVSAGTATFYLDGVTDGTATSLPGFTATRTGHDNANENFNGVVDEGAYYAGVALSGARIAVHYNTGTAVGTAQISNLQEFQNFTGTVLSAFDANGNLGIGTSAPVGKLDITDTSNTVASLSLTNNTATTIGNGANTLGALDLQSTSLTTGNFMNIELNALTSGKGINLSHTTSVIASGGSLANIASTSIDTGTTTGNLLNLSSTASLAGTQFLQTYSGLTTGIGQSLVTNALAAGTALSVTSTGTAVTGDLGKFELTGNSGAALTGNALKVGITGTTASGASVALNVTNGNTAATSYVARFNDDGTYTDSTPFVIDGAGNVGIGTTAPGYVLDVQHASSKINSKNGYLTDGADYAEWFSSSDPTIKEGEVVSLDSSGKITRSTRQNDTKVIGVISTNPGYVGNNPFHSMDEENANKETGLYKLVGLVGQVPTFVSGENGSIKVGDLLTTSNTPGIAIKALKAGQIIGKAEENYTGDGVGKIMMYVNITYADPNNILSRLVMDQSTEILGEATTSAGLTLTTDKVIANSIQVQDIIVDTNSDLVLHLDQNGQFLVKDENGNSTISFDNKGNATFAGLIIADTIQAKHIQGLDALGDQMMKLEAELQSLEATNSSTKVLGASTSESQNFDMASFKSLQVSGALTVGGPVEFQGIVKFIANVFFQGDVTFGGRIILNKDSGGFARINKGGRYVSIVFDRPYSQEPVISVNMVVNSLPDDEYSQHVTAGDCAGNDTHQDCERKLATLIFNSKLQYSIISKSKNGFEIYIDQGAPIDTTFSWIAIAVNNSSISKGEGESNTSSSSPLRQGSEGQATPLPTPIPDSTLESTASTTSLQGDQ